MSGQQSTFLFLDMCMRKAKKKFVTQKKHPFKFHEVQVGKRSLAAWQLYRPL